jgi:hypothetical protein
MVAGLIAVAGVLAALSPHLFYPPPRAAATLEAPPAGWIEVAWPFLNDGFLPGKAFECRTDECGSSLRVTLRAKIGFCNCDTGVSDDDELDRVGDIELVRPAVSTAFPGREIRVGALRGRARLYLLDDLDDRKTPALSIAYSSGCDALVATATGEDPARSEAAVLAFLGSDPLRKWVFDTLGH